MKNNSLKKIMWLIGIIIIACLYYFIIISDFQPKEYIHCLITQGRIERSSGLIGWYCLYTYTDGGKICKNSTECQGDCLVTENTLIEEDKKTFKRKVVGGIGMCQYDNRFGGCTSETIESPYSICD